MDDLVKLLRDVSSQLDNLFYDHVLDENLSVSLRDSLNAFRMHAFAVYKLFEEYD